MAGRPQTRARGGRKKDEWWPGNTAALKSGAQSARTIAPLAETFTAQLLEHAPWCDDPAFAGTVGSWSWTRAQIELLRAYLNEQGMLDENGEPRGGHVLLDRLEARLDSLGEHLALTPKSKVDLGIGLAMQRNMEMEGRILADSLHAALAGVDHDLATAIMERASAHLTGEPLPALPYPAIEAAIPDAEVIETDDQLADALSRMSRSQPPAGQDVRTDVGDANDPGEPVSVPETRDEAPPAETVVPIRREHNPFGSGNVPGVRNTWGHGETAWNAEMLPPKR
ncbi:hypothetical protein [Kribbella sp.]|uniref:hypothetical protein n=1 Tax=Kribbella sp. TaxID=1871183 RepID=UPI002D46DE6A|nr:hypothetical protein [Kribbella sp.]HZX07196.1 hypothetical protein [Kribbella sp.]